jgi:hypothetical protein
MVRDHNSQPNRPRPGHRWARHLLGAQRSILVYSVVGPLVLLTGGCAGAGSAPPTTSVVAATATQTSTGAATGRPATVPPAGATPLAKVPAKASPVPSHPGSGITVNAAGAVLPNSARTPGATNPSVTQADIGRTICVSGWTATVRPPSSVTTKLKVAQLASGYSYRGETATGDYEEDHLISLEIGGAPSAEANLWPEPYNTTDGARVKDVIENKLHDLVCSGTLPLATAQRAIASNWWTAYQTYVGAGPAPSAAKLPSVEQVPKPAPRIAPAAAQAGGATARCQDGTYSYAAHHQGACSGHGGAKVFYR